jgi:hypothetical protein
MVTIKVPTQAIEKRVLAIMGAKGVFEYPLAKLKDQQRAAC